MGPSAHCCAKKWPAPRAVCWLVAGALTFGPATAFAYVYPTQDQDRYGSVVDRLLAIKDQIASWSKVVGAMRTQIATLQKVQSAIRDVKGMIGGGVQGIVGEIADQFQVNEVLGIFNEVQNVYNDGYALARDVRALPEDAKRKLSDVGFAVDEVKEYLRNGIVYDTFHQLAVPEWKEVARHPWTALKNGSFGRACAESEWYIDEATRDRAFRAYVNSIPPNQQKQLGVFLGVKISQYEMGKWFDTITERGKAVADLRDVTNEISKAVEGKKKPTNEQREILLDHKAAAAAAGLKQKIMATESSQKLRAQAILQQSAAARLALKKLDADDAEADDAADAMAQAGDISR